MENFDRLLSLRPRLVLTVRGCYDDEADRQHLVQQFQEDADYRTNMENIRREEEMTRLITDEELRQAELINAGLPVNRDYIPDIELREDLRPLSTEKAKLPEQILPDLARRRAKVVHDHLVNTLNLPADRIRLLKTAPGGAQVDLSLVPLW
ncbi:MAG: hypothetical protein D3924_05715 [Candidatus Electrothrix sp. AR4]|nr:hypothetical protein [Candidatus Electrothrix sp. AR4]